MAWFGITRAAVSNINSFRGEEIAVGVATMLLLCIVAFNVQSLAPQWGCTPYSFVLLCILPGTRGILSGLNLAQSPRFRRRRLFRYLAVAGAAAAAGTYWWWPLELATTVGCLVNVRGYPPGWTRSMLLGQLSLAGTLAVLSGLVAGAFLYQTIHMARQDNTRGT